MLRWSPALLALAAVIASPSYAQTVIYTFNGTAPSQWLGFSVAGAGDVNADGYDDLIAGTNLSTARIYSGYEGKLLHELVGPAPNNHFGKAVDGAGDVDGDGYADVVVGDHMDGLVASGYAEVRSGADGSVLWHFDGEGIVDHFGWSVAGPGDLDGDGIPDVVIGAPQADPGGLESAGTLTAFSGADGHVLYTLPGDAQLDWLGYSVDGAGDANADGFPDIIGGAPELGSVSPGKGYARVYSGPTGATLFTVLDSPGGNGFGRTVAGIGHVNGDGHADVAVGAVLGWPENPTYVRVCSGAGGSVIYTLKSPSKPFGDWFGYDVSGAGDLDSDGLRDIVVGAPHDDPNGVRSGRVWIFSGGSGSILFHADGGAAEDQLGYSVSGAFDIDADGAPDVCAGTPSDDTWSTDTGSVRVVSGTKLPLASDVYQVSLSAGGTQALRLNAPQAPNAIYLLLGTASGPKPGIPIGGWLVPLTIDSYLLLTLASPNQPPLSGSLGLLSSTGTALAAFTLPPGTDPSLAGIVAHHAFVLVGPGLVSFASNPAPVSLVLAPVQ